MMIISSNVKKLYDGTSATGSAVQKGVDVWVDEWKIAAMKPHQAESGREVRRVDCS